MHQRHTFPVLSCLVFSRVLCWCNGGQDIIGDGNTGEEAPEAIDIPIEDALPDDLAEDEMLVHDEDMDIPDIEEEEDMPWSWADVSAGTFSTCSIDSSASLWCWGGNGYGELGDGTNESKHWPIMVNDDAGWADIILDGALSCGTGTGGVLWCWGKNSSGQVGDGTTEDRNMPVLIEPGSAWIAVDPGTLFTCGIEHDGTLWCWGKNDLGQLGNETYEDRTTPGRSGTGTDWVSIAAGGYHACGIKTDGTFWCWGDNEYGQLGDGTTGSRNTPVRVGSDDAWLAAAAGDMHSCGIKTNGTLWCWGVNASGQLGHGTFGMGTRTPARVGEDTDWQHVATGNSFTCGIKTDATLWCWGGNSEGQLGDGTSGFLENKVRPVPVAGDNWESISAGYRHACGTRAGGTLWCWGNNGSGQLGDGTIESRSVPTQVVPAEP